MTEERQWGICRYYRFSNKDIVDLFLNAVDRWFTDPQNSLYCKREYAQAALMDYLENDKEPEIQSNLIYVVEKFKNEWIGQDGVFEK